jgi:hypothetical protein
MRFREFEIFPEQLGERMDWKRSGRPVTLSVTGITS